MNVVKLTRTNAGRWNGPMYFNLGQVFAMQRLDGMTYVFASAWAEDGTMSFEVEETPEQIVAQACETRK